MRILRRLLIAALIALPLPAAAQFYLSGDEPAGKWKQIRTPGYRIVYPEAYNEQEVLAYAKALEYYTPYVGVSAGMAPGQYHWGKMPVVLHAYTPWSNGSVAWAPKRMDLYTLPEGYSSLAMPWVDQLVIHELRHVSQMQLGYRGYFNPINFIVGEMWNGAVAGLYSDKAVLEGDAVVAETALSNSGRGREAAFMNYYRVAFDNGDWRNWYRWRYGSFKYPAPDHYAAGYMMISGMRVFYGIPDWTAKYYDGIMRCPWPLGKLGRTSKKLTGQKYNESFRHIMESWQEVWEREDSLNGPYINGVAVSAVPDVETNYTGLIDVNGTVYAIKEGKAQAATLVTIDKDGTETVVCPVSASCSQFAYDEARNRLWWTERVSDWRWSMGGSVRIRYMCLDDMKQRDFTREGRYFTPSFSPDFKAISAASYPPEGGWVFSVFNADDGSLLWEEPCPFQITESAWGPDVIYAIGITEGGFAFWKHPADGPGRWEQISPASAQQIEALVYEDGLLVFTSDRSGLQQTYSLDPETLDCRQITNVQYGATDFTVYDGTLFYVSQDLMGRRVYVMPEDSLQPRRVRLDSLHSWTVADEMSRQEKVIAEALSSGSEVEISAPSAYSKFRHLVRFHSWAPIYFDYDEVSSMSGELSFSMASPGLTGLFQNDLGSLYGQIGYSAHPDAYSDGPWRHSGHLKLTYGGFYPKIEAGAAFNDHGTAVYHWNIVEKGDGGTLNTSYSIQNQIPSFNAYISAWLPLSQSKGGVTRGFIPKLTYSMSNSRFYTGAIELESSFPMELAPAFTGVRDGKTVIMQSLSGSVRAYSMLSRGESQTYPRWGIGAEMGGHIRPGLYQVFSPAMYGYIYGYVPGFTRLQGLRLNALAQYLFRGEEMFPEMRVNCAPRGFGSSVGSYMAAKGNFHIKAGADYAIPIYAGDLSIFGSAAYIRNFLLVPHTDAAMFGKTFLGSTGIDITAEFATLLGLPFGASLGVSLNCLYGGAMSELRELELVNRRPFSAELIFSMDI